MKYSLHTGCDTSHNVVGSKSRVRLDCERCSSCIDSTCQIATPEKVSQTRIHPAVGLAGSSRIIPYPPVTLRTLTGELDVFAGGDPLQNVDWLGQKRRD